MDKKRRPGSRVETPVERICKKCGATKPIDQFQQQNFTREQDWCTYRHTCKKCESEKALARYYTQQSLGKCSHCAKCPPTEGMTTCQACRDKNKVAKDESNLKLRTLVLVAYGRKCAHCGDRRIECLEIDHVGGWGKTHRDAAGERLAGYCLWVWIRDNGFPSSIRLLCGSCHSALSYFGMLPRRSITGDKLPIVAPLSDVSTDNLPCAPEDSKIAPGLVN